MSVPPSNPPPGGFPVPPQGGPNYSYYSQPPGRPTNNNAGCLQALGITCGVLLLLGIIGGFFAYRAASPYIQKFSQFGSSIVQASKNGRTIQQAVVAYHAQHHKYPPNLTALVADGEITDAKILHSDQDSNPNPGHISWRYMRPAEGDPGDTPILDLPYHLTVGNQTTTNHLLINLDGSTPNNRTTTVTYPPAGSSRD